MVKVVINETFQQAVYPEHSVLMVANFVCPKKEEVQTRAICWSGTSRNFSEKKIRERLRAALLDEVRKFIPDLKNEEIKYLDIYGRDLQLQLGLNGEDWGQTPYVPESDYE